MRRAINQRAFSGNADCSENIVAGAHNLSYAGLFEYFDSLSSRCLQLILEDYKAYQIKITFCCLTLHLLQRCPVVRNLFRRASYHAEASMGVEAEEFLVIRWDCTTSVYGNACDSGELTAFRSADFPHTFRSALHIDACIFIPSLRNNNARSSQLRYELEALDDIKLYGISLQWCQFRSILNGQRTLHCRLPPNRWARTRSLRVVLHLNNPEI